MEKLIKSKNGQWTLVKSSDDPESGSPWTEIHFSNGAKKGFPYKHQAVSHLLNNDYVPHDEESKDGTDHFHHIKDPSKTAKVIHYAKYDSDQNKDGHQNRRSSDIK